MSPKYEQISGFRVFSIREEGDARTIITCKKYRQVGSTIPRVLWDLCIYHQAEEFGCKARLHRYTNCAVTEIPYYEYSSVRYFLKAQRYSCPTEWLFSDKITLREIAKEFHG